MVVPADWKEVRLGDLGSTFGGLTGKSSKDFGEGNSIFVTFMNVMSNVVLNSQGTEKVRIGDGERQSQLLEGDVIFNGSSETPEEVGFGSTVPLELSGLYLNSFCFGFRRKDTKSLDPKFFAYLTRSPLGRDIIRPMAQGSTRYNIAKTNLLNGRFPLPPLKEQEAIAEALSDADAAIESLYALIAKKRDVKQAAMQQHAEAERVGPDARMVALGSVAVINKGELITSTTSGEGPYPVIAGGKSPAYFSSKFNRDGLTITISASGANAGYVALRKGKIWASDCSTISEDSSFDMHYLAAQLEVRQEKIYKAQFGGAQPHVRPNDLAPLEICYVPLVQQQEIGRALRAIDDELEALTQQVLKLRMVKDGMMQDLLTGKVRLV